VPRERLPPQTVAFIALPIEVERRTIGVLACHRIRSRHRQLADDLAILKILATLAGQLLQLERLLAATTKGLQERNALLTRALESAAAAGRGRIPCDPARGGPRSRFPRGASGQRRAFPDSNRSPRCPSVERPVP
jgi:GAF domain-containing protein